MSYLKNFDKLPNIIKVGFKKIGYGQPVFIIAEIGNNHNGNFELAKKSIEVAAHCGADAVKFQKRTLQEVFTKEMLDKPQTNSRSLGATYGEYRKSLELSDAQLLKLRHYAKSLGLAFFVTPFDIKSADTLEKLDMDAYKIASFDLTHKPLLEHVAKKGKPIFLSTGMASLEETDKAVNIILQHNKKLIIKHCVSIYPTPDDDLNMGAIKTMIERYRPLPVGYSGHEIGYIPTIAAVALGASSVERHFTLDKSLPGPDHATVSLDVGEFYDMCRQIRRIEKAVADDKIYMHEKEIPHRNKHGKSIVLNAPVKAGMRLTADILACKSPGYGIPPYRLHEIIGRKINTDLEPDTVILDSHLV